MEFNNVCISTNRFKSSTNLLTDNFGRSINYLRIAITDRCNLRCTYCMPAEGIQFAPKEKILTFEEIEKIAYIFSNLGITKIRLTGGEPFVRKDFIYLLKNLAKNTLIKELHITTNGVETHKYIDQLIDLKISGINLSIDSLNRDNFKSITRRDNLSNIIRSLNLLRKSPIKVKVNCVVQKGINENEIVKIAGLAKNNIFDVRFIEQMPFNNNNDNSNIMDAEDIRDILSKEFDMNLANQENSETSEIYTMPNYKGRIGIIAGYTRSFCGTCNRVRITSSGQMKTCLYDNGNINIKNLINSGFSDLKIQNEIIEQIGKRYKDGFEAEKNSQQLKLSMASIGG